MTELPPPSEDRPIPSPREHGETHLVSAHLAARAAERRVLAATSLVCFLGVGVLVAVLLRHGPGAPLGDGARPVASVPLASR